MTSILRILLPVLAFAPTLTACALSVSPVTGRQRAYAYTWQQEIQIGRQADREIVERFGEYGDPALEEYVRRVGQAVLAVSHLRREGALPEYRETKFVFRVLDTGVVNAFAMPGGYVYVTRGLLAHLQNEAQLAVLLGHEIAHVAARHGSQNALDGGLTMIGLMGAGVLAEEAAGAGHGVGAFNGIAAQLLLFRYSRDDERESDRLGVEYAALAGYDAAEGADFFVALQRLQARTDRLPAFLSTHPDPGRREQTVAQLAMEWAGRGHDGRRVEREAYLEHIDGMLLGEDPRQGFDDDGMFYHPAGGFRFPLPYGWQAVRDGRQVRISPRGGGGVQVEFGAGSRFPTADAAASAFIAENPLRGPTSYRTEMNGFPGARVEGWMGEDEGPSYHVVGYWLEHGDDVVRFAGIAEDGYGQALLDAVGEMTRGFRALTDESILSMQPTRLTVGTTEEAGPFREFVDPGAIPRGMDLEWLAILNGVEMDEIIPAGMVLKLPG